ncbi:MAG: hypothetical protein Hals2KO_33170 [Halioglobus sp.]
MKHDGIERRAYFRINDVIGLSYSVVEGDEEQPRDSASGTQIQLLGLLSKIDNDINEVTNLLWRESANAARAIGLLNRKISLIASHLLREDGEIATTYNEMTASISGCGMAFHSEEPVQVESRLRMSAILKPSNIELRFTARVVACERVAEIPSTSYLMRISIDESCDEAREQLIQHVVQRQFDDRHQPGQAAESGD